MSGIAAGGSGLRALLLHRGAYRWYAGTLFGLAYQVIEIVSVWLGHGSLGTKTLATVLLSLFYFGYILIPPLVWDLAERTRVITLALYWAATFFLIPLIGANVVWVWPLVVAMVAFCWLPSAVSVVLSGLVIAAQIPFAVFDAQNGSIPFAPFVTLTVVISLLGITRQIIANRKLQDAQSTIATLAAAEERARLARDLHDVLGHSLTVVAVKSELAGRLVDIDPARAVTEIAEIESLARTALADLRGAVSGYREVDLDSELTNARTALEAAGIESHLPADGAAVAAELRPLFGWVVREGVTNVIRHSQATACWVELEPRVLRVRDDGTAAGSTGGAGNGLRGLRERAREAGAELTTVVQPSGGFVLAVAGAAS